MKNDLVEMLQKGMTKEELEKEFKDQLAAAVKQVEQEKKEEEENLLAETRQCAAVALAKYVPLAWGVEGGLTVAECEEFLKEFERIVTFSLKDYVKPAESAVDAVKADDSLKSWLDWIDKL